jgi:hypothetical protein
VSALNNIYNNKATKNKEVSRNRQYFERIRYSRSACQALLSIQRISKANLGCPTHLSQLGISSQMKGNKNEKA